MLKTYFIFTLGCQMNVSDSERIKAILEKYGLTPVDEKSADLIVVNACSVRQRAVDRIWGKLRVWQRINPKAKKVLTGCVLAADLKKLEEKFDFCFEINDLARLESYLAPYNVDKKNQICHSGLDPESINKIDSRWSLPRRDSCFRHVTFRRIVRGFRRNDIRGGNDSDEMNSAQNYLEIEPKRREKETAYVPIMSGCNNFCSYCAVPYTRGREWSRSPKAILGEVKCLIEKGYKEILLLGQNICSYRNPKSKTCLDSAVEPRRICLDSAVEPRRTCLDSAVEPRRIPNPTSCRAHSVRDKQIQNPKVKIQNNDFVKLLKKLVKIKGSFKIQFMSPHPKDFSDKLIDLIAQEEKISKEIHLPMQSGDDEILRKMNRGYTAEEYLELIKNLKLKIRNLRLSTDIIVGFPGETEQNFRNTVKLVKLSNISKAYISIYSPRNGTLAQKNFVDSVPYQIKKKRWLILEKMLNKKTNH